MRKASDCSTPYSSKDYTADIQDVFPTCRLILSKKCDLTISYSISIHIIQKVNAIRPVKIKQQMNSCGKEMVLTINLIHCKRHFYYLRWMYTRPGHQMTGCGLRPDGDRLCRQFSLSRVRRVKPLKAPAWCLLQTAPLFPVGEDETLNCRPDRSNCRIGFWSKARKLEVMVISRPAASGAFRRSKPVVWECVC
jgi:hypothetical protein